MDESVQSRSERARARSPYQPLVIVSAALAAGLVFDRYGQHHASAVLNNPAGSPIWIAVSWVIALSCLVAWWLARRRQYDKLAAWPLLFAVAFTGATWHDWQWRIFGQHEISRYANYAPAPACVEVIARETPEQVSASQPTPLRAFPSTEQSRLPVELVRVRDGTGWQPASGLSQLTVQGHLLGVHAGDRLLVFAQLARPAPTLNPGEFDFAAHARADRQLARLRSSAPECVTIIAHAAWTPRSLIDLIRVRAKQLVRTFVGPNRAGLAAAILLGAAREGLPYDETEPYLVTGTIHVLVVSGMNVAILATGLLLLMRCGWLSRRVGLAVIIVVVVLYALVAESQPPVVRAAVLAIFMCLAAWTGRQGVAFNSLSAAAIVVLAINPSDLFRAGPQLSFLAVAMLIWIGQRTFERNRIQEKDRLTQLIEASRPWYQRAGKSALSWIAWMLVTSTVVWLSALPLVLSQFHVISPVSVLISPAVWVAVFAAMWSGFFMLVTGWLIPSIGSICGAICNLSLGGLESAVHWAESLPAPGHMWAPGPAWWWIVVFYVGLMAAIIWGRTRFARRWQVAALCCWILVGLAPSLLRVWTRNSLDCSFVAVGHGTCVVLEAPTGETILYDAGAIGSPEYATQTIASYLWHRGIMRIDGIVISHADIDHFNAVPGLLERFSVGAIYVSPVMFDEFGEASTDAPRVLEAAIRDASVPIRQIWSGDRLRVGSEIDIDVLHPPRRGIVGNDNANSLTLAVSYKGQRLLLPGDLESPGLDDVMAELPYDCDVLMAPHHGSRRSDPPGFAAWSSPEWVVISGGGGDDIEPVRKTYERAGAVVLATIEKGAVRFTLENGAKLQVTSWLNAAP